jgi:hypothetical protein
MKLLEVDQAIGEVLAHDMTQIIPGKFKGARFKKGHLLTKDDIPILLDMGKRNVYVVDKEDNDMHEDIAAQKLAEAIAGPGVEYKMKNEGKAEFKSKLFGLLKIDKAKLSLAVASEPIIISTIHSNQVVRPDDILGATRIMPLYIKPELITSTLGVLSKPASEKGVLADKLISIRPISKKKIGIVTTGNEVFTGRIEDKFGPVLREKLGEFDADIIGQTFCDDDENMIAAAISDFIKNGADIVCTTGGMSVDPDDKTPSGIRSLNGEIITYGTPVLPGAMCMLAKVKNVPVVGLPGCVMYSKRTIFDLLIPRILADDIPTKNEIDLLAHGGFCRNCDICVFPICEFGKG